MEERRKYKRTELNLGLTLRRLDPGSEDVLNVEVSDLSKSGIGFISDHELQLGSVYEANITIWTKEVLHAFIQIARIELREGGYNYGGVFIGMPEMDAARIEVYQTIYDN